VDPIMDNITGRDQLLFYGRIKGVPEVQLSAKVDGLLLRLGLEQSDANKKAGEYSGGMKRKLSVPIALIGHSKVLFLDEPSAAVDAGAKRHLWKVINNRASDQTVVLTTHSMEEAEALCDRLAIQVQGQLRCLGTPMHIRSKYGHGYQVELIVRPPRSSNNMRISASTQTTQHGPSPAILDLVHGCITDRAKLLEFHSTRYLFQLPALGGNLSLGKIITQISANKVQLGISDWSIERPTLEQVFLRFAREQDEEVLDAVSE